MANDIPRRNYFPKVKEAREALKAKALELYELQEKAIRAALEAGEYEVAIKAIQWLQEHLPADDGVTAIDSSIDTPKPAEKGSATPTIQIGFQLGGIPMGQPQLPAPTQLDSPSVKILDVTEINEPNHSTGPTDN